MSNFEQNRKEQTLKYVKLKKAVTLLHETKFMDNVTTENIMNKINATFNQLEETLLMLEDIDITEEEK